MLRLLSVLVVSLSMVIGAQKSQGQEAPKKLEPAFPPPPMIVPQPVGPPTFVIPDMPRPGTREQWQYYGVDSFGRFRPRVILSPSGSYYLGNLQPYPWTSNRSTAFMPFAVD